jgi:hypothetical protein
MLVLVCRHNSLLIGSFLMLTREQFMPVLSSFLTLLGKASLSTEIGMTSHFLAVPRSSPERARASKRSLYVLSRSDKALPRCVTMLW